MVRGCFLLHSCFLLTEGHVHNEVTEGLIKPSFSVFYPFGLHCSLISEIPRICRTLALKLNHNNVGLFNHLNSLLGWYPCCPVFQESAKKPSARKSSRKTLADRTNDNDDSPVSGLASTVSKGGVRLFESTPLSKLRPLSETGPETPGEDVLRTQVSLLFIDVTLELRMICLYFWRVKLILQTVHDDGQHTLMLFANVEKMKF